jgi:hypothetical protein
VLNNREWAGVIWLVAFGLLLLWKHQLGKILGDFLRAIADPTILLTLLGVVAYTAGLAYIGSAIGLWNAAMVKDTVIWFFAVAMSLLLHLSDSATPGYFRTAATRSVKIGAFLAFFLNLFVFNIWIELLLVPLLFVVLAIPIVGRGQPQYASAVGLANRTSAFIGLAVAGYVAWKLVTSWQDVASRDTLLSLALPIWMTLGFLPFIYVYSLWANYRTAFMRIDFASNDRRSRRRAKLALIVTLGLRTSAAGSFRWPWIQPLAESPTWRDARKNAKDYRAHWRDPDEDDL